MRKRSATDFLLHSVASEELTRAVRFGGFSYHATLSLIPTADAVSVMFATGFPLCIMLAHSRH
ncbi:MAG: hypothetical protein EOO38_09745 [Cytophagaceae bacterium]|nr:MAG: hypothetical protein EOO38_09745 [Cytophagaceae bacterium]